ncbi:MAG: polyhydroxyalkanoate synthesis regulator DNA-binding domain-containing protein [Myxococcota bacterium]
MSASEPRIIKRYANRKLYDTVDSQYITLKTISELIKKNNMVRIIDNDSGEDLTRDFLLQIIRKQEKKWKLFPLQSLVQMIKMGRTSSNDFLHNLKSDMDLRMGDIPKISDLKEAIENYQRRFEEWQKNIENQLHTILEAPSTLLSKEIDFMKKRLISLEDKVQELKNKIEKNN